MRNWADGRGQRFKRRIARMLSMPGAFIYTFQFTDHENLPPPEELRLPPLEIKPLDAGNADL